ncbi:MAG: UvrD-helicase domain-containing protein [Chlamydiales bacterium]|nr:UvrD-helicase domain-containing protein [Chlamydiales bacterium]
MKRFDIHCRNLNIYQHHNLEASAGTGKTYSIEHLVTRLLIENGPRGEPCRLSEILVVTFTRAATRELRGRIRANIANTLLMLRSDPMDGPDYLKAICEDGDGSRCAAIHKLERALATFEESQIYTIHSFCSRILRECDEMSIASGSSLEDRQISKAAIHDAVKDYLRTEVNRQICSPAQLERLLKKQKNLVSQLAKTSVNSAPVEPFRSYASCLDEFCLLMKDVKRKLNLTSESIVEDFKCQASSYKQFKSTSAIDYLPEIERFAALFDSEDWTAEHLDILIRDDLLLPKVLDPSLLKKKATCCPRYPSLVQDLRPLMALVDSAREPANIYSVLAAGCQQFVQRYIQEEELVGSDQLLIRAAEACQRSEFRQSVASRYRFAIIDEFQDTDPNQWKVLEEVFLRQSDTFIALVGDPKQAIYSFRQADINTYFNAVNCLPDSAHASLEVNYRSSPQLVEAINTVFSSENSPQLLSKPYRPLQANAAAKPSTLLDGRGAMHFVIAEGKSGKANWAKQAESRLFVPYIANEIKSLVAQGCSYKDIAILVRDRYQSSLLVTEFKACGIPVALERSGSVVASPAYLALADLLKATLKPRDRSAVLQCLGGCFIALTASQAQQLLDSTDGMKLFYHLNETLLNYGVQAFFDAAMQSKWYLSSQTLQEHLLGRSDGLSLYRDLRHLILLLAQAELQDHVRAEGLLQALLDLQQLSDDDDEQLQIRDDANQDAVRVMTIHVSKGLEFRFVFALGLISRSKAKEWLIHSREENHLIVDSTDNKAKVDTYYKECDEEKVRLAYVAMTRAKERLYVPVAVDQKGPEEGEASAMELILGRIGQPSATLEEVYCRLSTTCVAPLLKVISQIDSTVITHEQVTEGIVAQTAIVPHVFKTLEMPTKINVPGDPICIHSFTSLDALTPHEVTKAGTSPSDLHVPAGTETGILLHQILQNTPFDDLTFDAVEKELTGTSLMSWSKQIHEMLNHVVNTPLSFDDEMPTLRAVQPSEQFRELEFLFSLEDAQALALEPQTSGYIKGFIDLVLTYNNRYYIVDWKSNWLGPNVEDYNQDKLHQVMLQHGYHLQARLYTEALRRYISLFDDRPFEQCFGGMYFLFLRGMRSESPNSGVYIVNPLEAALCLE